MSDYFMVLFDDPQLLERLNVYLSKFVTLERKKRIQEVLAQRTRHVAVVLEDLYQTQNISAVMRTCDCLGVQDAYIIENRNAFEIHDDISTGAHKWLTLHRYPHEVHNIEKCIDDLHAKGYFVAATLPDGKRTAIGDLPVARRTAFLFGTELEGLSEAAVRCADDSVFIPMYGFTESFNISNSAAIILSDFTERMRRSSVNWSLDELEKKQLYCEWLQKSLRNPDKYVSRFLAESG